MSWLIKNMHEELKAREHLGGNGNKLIFKSNTELVMKRVREALAKYHGGEISPEQPPKGESQLNGYIEQDGRRSGA